MRPARQDAKDNSRYPRSAQYINWLLVAKKLFLRSSGQSAAQAVARANAGMALTVAIGELQKQMGPNQWISANGSILSNFPVNHPPCRHGFAS